MQARSPALIARLLDVPFRDPKGTWWLPALRADEAQGPSQPIWVANSLVRPRELGADNAGCICPIAGAVDSQSDRQIIEALTDAAERDVVIRLYLDKSQFAEHGRVWGD